MKQVFGRNFKYVDELYCNVTAKMNTGGERELDDCEALKYLQNLHIMNGNLCVITDFCYETKCGPFVMDASEINSFVDTFLDTYGETFYASDIVIISFEEKLIWVLFHEGICWLSEG